MRLCRFGDRKLGLVEGGIVRDVSGALAVLPAVRYPFPGHDLFIESIDNVMEAVNKLASEAPSVPLDAVRLHSPVANPSKIIGAPVNYQKHLDEVRSDAELHYDNQAHTAVIHKTGLFLKACSSLAGPSEGIALRKLDRRNDHDPPETHERWVDVGNASRRNIRLDRGIRRGHSARAPADQNAIDVDRICSVNPRFSRRSNAQPRSI